MDFKGRINQLAMELGMNKTALQEQIGLSNSYFANVNRVSGKVASKIKQLYPQINIEWLNEGTGNMFINQDTASECKMIPLLPVSAAAGSLSEFSTQVHNYDCEMLISPAKDIDLAMPVSGESMQPEYPNGSKVFLKKINEAIFIEWGKAYVIDTVNGSILKIILPCKENDSKIICHSINPNYPDFQIDKKNIIGLYRVIMLISMK